MHLGQVCPSPFLIYKITLLKRNKLSFIHSFIISEAERQLTVGVGGHYEIIIFFHRLMVIIFGRDKKRSKNVHRCLLAVGGLANISRSSDAPY